MVRPSYVLGGRAMEVVLDEAMLRQYMAAAMDVSPERPILIDRFLQNAIEAEADAIADGTDAFVPAVMEHIELAGIHSGDSACVIPPVSIRTKHMETIYEYTRKIAMELKWCGLMNIQYAIADDTVYILEANPRASRTVPLVSKVCNISMARIATQIMLGKSLRFHLRKTRFPISESRKPYSRLTCFPRSIRCWDRKCAPPARCWEWRIHSAWPISRPRRPPRRSASAFRRRADHRGGPRQVRGSGAGRLFKDLQFRVFATNGTRSFLTENGIETEPIRKLGYGRPDIVDAIKNGEIQLVINTPSGKESQEDDSYIRKAAINYKVPYITTTAAALAAAKGIKARREGDPPPRSLHEYHDHIR
jgi:carbamoyl-phosphate synthase large subunit